MILTANTILDNDGAGIDYGNDLPHLRPSLVTDDLVRSNRPDSLRRSKRRRKQINARSVEPPPLMVTNCDVEGGYDGQGNVDVAPVFVDDGRSVKIAQVAFHPENVQSWVQLAEAQTESSQWAGRVVRLGDRWGLIARAPAPDRLVIWGDLSSSQPAPTVLRLLPTYRQRPDSPARQYGYTPELPQEPKDQ